MMISNGSWNTMRGIAAAALAQVLELMEAVDEHIPTPARDLEKPFVMGVEEVFGKSGRGTVVTGRVEQGVLNVGQEIEIVGKGMEAGTVVTCSGLASTFRMVL